MTLSADPTVSKLATLISVSAHVDKPWGAFIWHQRTLHDILSVKILLKHFGSLSSAISSFSVAFIRTWPYVLESAHKSVFQTSQGLEELI